MDLSFLMQYLDIVIVGICLCVGFVVKKWVDDVDNKYIPTIVAILGLLLKVAFNYKTGINEEVVLSGLFSGLASTGCYEMFKNLIGKEK